MTIEKLNKEDWMPREIQIIGQDSNKTKKSNRGTAVCFFYIELNQIPNEDWIKLFQNERENLKHNLTIPFEVDGKYIVIECTSEQLSKMYLPELRRNIQDINTQ